MKMDFSQIKAASAQLLADTRAAVSDTQETTPADITPAILNFAEPTLGGTPVFVPVVSDPHGLYGWCSDGVKQKIAADGGGIAFGWIIWEWRDAMLTAEFHAVWRDPDRNLIDITPKPSGEARILFVHDAAYPANFDFDQRPRNRRVRIRADQDLAAAAAALRAKLTPSQERYEQRRADKAGLALDQWLARKVPADPLNDAIDKAIAACVAFEEHYDSLGAAGLIVPDDEFRRLALRRDGSVQKLKRLTRPS